LGSGSVVAQCVEVETQHAERAISALRSLGLLLPNSKAKSYRCRGVVRLPVIGGLSRKAVDALGELGISATECVDEFEVGSRGLRYVDLLRGVIPEEALRRLPKSYQLVGDVAIVHLPEDLLIYGRVIGEAIARISKGVRAVYSSSATEGEFRVRRLIRLWGEDVGETVHVEYGVKIVVDVGRVYFNPTLSYEHWRVSEEVGDGERVLDLFSGVGPYSLHIASKRRATCFAVDSNPWAAIYLAKSIAMNKLLGKVVVVVSRVDDFLEEISSDRFTRVIVDLPHRSLEYLEKAVAALTCGGYAHIYALGGEEPPIRNLEGYMRLVETRRVLEYAPRKYIYGLKIVKKC